MSSINNKNQKGISLLFVTLVMSVVLAVSLGISGILIQQSRMLTEVGYSVISFYAADSGVERQLYDLYKGQEGEHQNQYISPAGTFDDDASFDVIAKCSTSTAICFEGFAVDTGCDAINYCIKSIGDYQETKRAIEIKY